MDALIKPETDKYGRQPIATAPKDRTKIDVWDKNNYKVRGVIWSDKLQAWGRDSLTQHDGGYPIFEKVDAVLWRPTNYARERAWDAQEIAELLDKAGLSVVKTRNTPVNSGRRATLVLAQLLNEAHQLDGALPTPDIKTRIAAGEIQLDESGVPLCDCNGEPVSSIAVEFSYIAGTLLGGKRLRWDLFGLPAEPGGAVLQPRLTELGMAVYRTRNPGA